MYPRKNPDYMQMFPRTIRDLLAPFLEGPLQQTIADDTAVRDFMRGAVMAAKVALKRGDRIAWYLRLYRLGIANAAQRDVQNLAQMKEQGYLPWVTAEWLASAETTFGRLLKAYNKKARRHGGAVLTERTAPLFIVGHGGRISVPLNPDDDLAWAFPGEVTDSLLQYLQHFTDLGLLAEDDEIVFGWRSPQAVLTELQDIEEAALEHMRVRVGKIPLWIAEDYPVLKDFDDGFVWFDALDYKPADEAEINLKLRAEGKGWVAGHCSTCDDPEHKALVLREYIHSPTGDHWRPVLQFCLDPDGYLHEMKGVGNARPDKKYHKYIIWLLEQPFTTGLMGGGYMDETNFALEDLGHDEQVRLATRRASLFGLERYIELRGLTASAREALAELDRPLNTSLITDDRLVEEIAAVHPEVFSFIDYLLRIGVDDYLVNALQMYRERDREYPYPKTGDVFRFAPTTAEGFPDDEILTLENLILLYGNENAKEVLRAFTRGAGPEVEVEAPSLEELIQAGYEVGLAEGWEEDPEMLEIAEDAWMEAVQQTIADAWWDRLIDALQRDAHIHMTFAPVGLLGSGGFVVVRGRFQCTGESLDSPCSIEFDAATVLHAIADNATRSRWGSVGPIPQEGVGQSRILDVRHTSADDILRVSTLPDDFYYMGGSVDPTHFAESLEARLED